MRYIGKLVLLIGLFLLAISTVAGQTGQLMSVQVRETQMRQRASFVAPVVATLDYADRVEVLQEAGSWIRVRFQDQEGWVSGSALTTQRIVLQAGGSNVDTTATSSEVALAGRGFNREVEAQYQSTSGLDFSWVDRMEDFAVDYTDLFRFLDAMGSPLAEGGR